MLRFSEFEVDADRLSIHRRGLSLEAPPQVVEVLAYLIEHEDRIVGRKELLDRFWPRAGSGGDAALNTCVRRIRTLLDDDADVPRFIQTRPRAGYRFVGGPVSRNAPRGGTPEVLVDLVRDDASPPNRKRLVGVALSGAALAAALAAGLAWSHMRTVDQYQLIAIEPATGLCEYVLFPRFNEGLRESFQARMSSALPPGYGVTTDTERADLLARISVRQTPEQTVVVLTMIDEGSSRSLWSREFSAPTDSENYVPLQQHLAEQMASGLAQALRR